MLKKIINIIVCFVIFTTQAAIDIITLNQIAPYLSPYKKTLIVFDIDNTLYHLATDLGSDQWFCHEVQKHIKNGLTTQEAVNAILPLYIHIHHNRELIPTEPELLQTFQTLTSKASHIICLTARSSPLAQRTLQQLKDCKNFLSSAFPDYPLTTLRYPAYFKEGIIFSGSNNKGEVLREWLQTMAYIPERIIAIDDKQSHLEAIQHALSSIDCEYIALRYAGCDQRVNNFNAEQTEQELQEFLMSYPQSALSSNITLP